MGKGSAGRFLWVCVVYIYGHGGYLVGGLWLSCGVGRCGSGGGGGSVSIFPGFFASVEGALISGETGHWAIIL